MSCNFCPWTGFDQQGLSQHQNIHTPHSPKKKHICVICKKSLASIRNLQRHVKFHSRKRAANYKCSSCLFSNSSKKRFQKHIKDFHYKRRSINCTKCDTKSETKKDLLQHDKQMHQQTKQRKIKQLKTCNICDFKCHSRLDKHIKKHIASYIDCSTCKKHVKDTPNTIKRHNATHSKLTQKCEVCQNMFMTKHGLGVHMKTHGVEMKFECIKCFKSVVNLSGHRRYCEDIRNVPCKMCSKMFGIKSEMMRHLKQSHLNQRNFKCKICPKSYTDLTPLRHHLNSAHGDGSTFSHCLICKKSFTTTRRFIEHNTRFHDENIKINENNDSHNNFQANMDQNIDMN